MSVISQIRNARNKEMEAAGTRAGFYLVKGDDRHFISVEVSEPALNRVADRVLSDAKGWSYWVDYSYGVDVHGKPAWANIDQVDRFF